MSREAQLIDAAVSGDLSAFEDLISQYEKKIFNYCYRMTNSREDAEDLTQEVFIKVYRRLRIFKGGSRFSTWVYRIAYNTCVDKHRKKKVQTMSLSPQSDEEKEVDLPSKDPSPEDILLKDEQRRILQQCIEALKPEYKTVIILRDIQNHTYEEISKILDIPLGTVKSHISRARLALRQIVKQNYKGGE
jgi:RNA polymerase sigma-70 factor (ECF subfamily)